MLFWQQSHVTQAGFNSPCSCGWPCLYYPNAETAGMYRHALLKRKKKKYVSFRYIHATPCMWRWGDNFHDLTDSGLGPKDGTWATKLPWQVLLPAEPISSVLCPSFSSHADIIRFLGQVGESVHCGNPLNAVMWGSLLSPGRLSSSCLWDKGWWCLYLPSWCQY